MWMETDPGTRINQHRLHQVLEETEAERVVTACPYCLIMFDDAILSKGVGEQVSAMDIAEAFTGVKDETSWGMGGTNDETPTLSR